MAALTCALFPVSPVSMRTRARVVTRAVVARGVNVTVIRGIAAFVNIWQRTRSMLLFEAYSMQLSTNGTFETAFESYNYTESIEIAI